MPKRTLPAPLPREELSGARECESGVERIARPKVMHEVETPNTLEMSRPASQGQSRAEAISRAGRVGGREPRMPLR
jgi:hypothetical protein